MRTDVTPLSALFVPGDRPERFDKAAAAAPGAVVFDLEDAVALANKPAARLNVRERLLATREGLVRLNAAQSGELERDFAVLGDVPPPAVMLAKAESANDIARVRIAFGEATAIVLLIETALGLRNLPDLLQAAPIWCVAFGSLDYAVDLGVAHTPDALQHARSEIVFRSRVAGICPPIDGVTMEFKNPAVVAAESRRSVELGFAGKLAIHPSQLAPIREGFRPPEADILWAKRVMDAVGAGGVIQLDGSMVDAPVVERAKRVLQRAQI